MPKLNKILYLSLGEVAHYECIENPVPTEEIKTKLKEISDNIENWNGQKGEILFISPAPFEKLKELKDKIVKFEGKIYIAPNDDELNKAQELFKNTNATMLYSNIDDFKGDYLARLMDTLICEDHRVKFKVKKEETLDEWEKAIKELFTTFKKYGKIIGSKYNNKPKDGSLSMRFGENFLVTASRKDKTKLEENDLVLVTSIESPINYQGKNLPSSETVLHGKIYDNFPEVLAIIHPHYKKITNNEKYEKFRTPIFIPYGTKELADAAIKILKNNNFAILKNHGEVVIGKSFEEIIEILEKLNENHNRKRQR